MRVQLHLPPLRSLDLLISPGTLLLLLDDQLLYVNVEVDTVGGCACSAVNYQLHLRQNDVDLLRVTEVTRN